MELMYSSTRNDKVKLTASQAILKGLADDGGLFVPERIPALDVPMDTLADMSYQETAYEVMSRFFTDFTEDELKDCIKKAYDSKFDTPEIAPLVDADGAYYLELFHGPTIAFKDMALSILPHLLITSARKNQVKNDIVFNSDIRRYRKSCPCRICRRRRHKDCCILSEERCQPDSGKADDHTERCKYLCGWNPRKL